MQCNYNAHPKCASHLHTVVVVVAFAAGYKFLFVVNVNACTDVLAITLAVVVAVVVVVVIVVVISFYVLLNPYWCCCCANVVAELPLVLFQQVRCFSKIHCRKIQLL